MAFDPLKFLREVRTETVRATFPSRRETAVTTGLVIAMAAATAAFFFIADQVFSIAVRALFGFGG
ncbi:MAG: preprotein translocase subunit SecE [Rhodospirillales bacterium]|nr:preprotein translocase subunit SecE [Rhodospirillales bacterium]